MQGRHGVKREADMPDRIDRRGFLKAAAAGAAISPAACAGPGAAPPPQAGVYRQPAADVPVVEEADVVVCGAGPAGVAAAIAAARAGAKTRLLEVNGCLGGIWTAGLLCWILDSRPKGGLMKEIAEELVRRGEGFRPPQPGEDALGYDVEAMKLLLDEMCGRAGVRVRLHTRVAAAPRAGKDRVAYAVTESKSGREAWAAKVFVDTTGDGDLAAQAGCGFDLGQAGTGRAQPLSLMAILAGPAGDAIAPFVRSLAEPRGEPNPKRRLLDEFKKAGVEPSYHMPTLFPLPGGLFCMMANHEYGVRADDAAKITEATLRARAEVHRLVDALRGLGGIWKDLRIVVTAEQIGVREGRRVRGLHTVSEADLVSGARHDDAVCRVFFPVDVHSPDPAATKGILGQKVRAKPYDVPLRALIARDAENLLMAGRCISGDFIAHSSYRVTGNSVPMGEAAGAAAALAAARGIPPREVPWADVRKKLEKSGVK
jgi:hypothetical protein